MKKIFFTPGPSELYFTVDQHIKEALKKGLLSVSHREKEYVQIHKETTDALRELLQLPDNFTIGFTSSATEVWDLMSENLIGEHSYHFVNGSFSDKFHKAASAKGLNAKIHKVEGGNGFDLDNLNIPDEVELIGLTQNETSTGVGIPMEDIKTLRKKYPNPLLAIDAVSSLPIPVFDFNLIDSLYFSVQKSFGLPAGLGIWIFNERCIAQAEVLKAKGQFQESYNSIFNIAKLAKKHQTTCTPNVLNIYLLGKVVQDMLNKGIDQIRKDSKYKQTLLEQLFESHPNLSPFVEEVRFRSQTVSVANVKGGSEALIAALAVKGLLIGNGYGPYKNKQIRIANFPTHSKEQIEMLVDEINQLDF